MLGLILYQWILLTVIHDCITSSVKLKLSVAKIRSIWMVVESNGSASLLLNTHQSITNSREAQWQELYSKLFSQYRYRTKLIMVDGAPKFCKEVLTILNVLYVFSITVIVIIIDFYVYEFSE